MSTYGAERRTVRGEVRRRLLVNALVDPDEAADRLPTGLRPHVTPLGTVVGCCLLDLDHLRPAALPPDLGVAQRAVACRISAAWTDPTGATVVGVWVPGRRTTSRLAVAAGGRWFPGVHRPAGITVELRGDRLCWRVEDDGEFRIDVTVSTADAPGDVDEVVGGTCLHAAIGVSADHRGRLEAARMQPNHHRARRVVVEQLDSPFIAGFRTAVPAPSYLMEHALVDWTPASPPAAATVAA